MDIELYCQEKGNGEPLILLHGNGEDSTYFENQMEYFQSRYRVISLDTRGHGKSPRGTKPFKRFAQCIPEDWADGYENVTVCCTIENQRNADKKLSVFQTLPIKHRCITAQPLIERVDLEPYLDGVELVVVGGESDRNARPLDYDWVLDIREQCIRKRVNFEFRQCGTHFIKDGRQYKLQTKDLCRQARLAGINYKYTNELL